MKLTLTKENLEAQAKKISEEGKTKEQGVDMPNASKRSSTPKPMPAVVGHTLTLTLHLSAEREAKLKALAAQRGTSLLGAIYDFLDKAQPGGSGWQHPASKAKD